MPSPPRKLLCRGGSPPPRRGFVRSHLQVWAGWLLLGVLLLQVRVGHAQALPNLLDNSSFEQSGAPNTNGAPAAVHAYNGTGTPFGTNVNALRWVGGVNGVSPFNTPIARMQVLAVGSQAKVSWVHSPKALDGTRYLLLEGTNSCVDLRAVSGGNWGSVLLPGRTYEFCLWADTAGNADSSFTLTLEAGASVFRVGGVNYQYYIAPQQRWTGTPVPKFSAADYNGWNEATGNGTLPNWRKFTFRFAIPATATAAQLNQASLIIAGGTNSGPIASDGLSLNEVRVSIGDTIWTDANNDGLRNNGETGVAGAVVGLFRAGPDTLRNTADDIQVGTDQTTGASGAYLFTNLDPGVFFVKVTPPATHPFTSGTPDTADNQEDDDNNGTQPGGAGTAVLSPLVTLSPGTESTTDGDGADSDRTIDFGLFEGVRIGNRVWLDNDGDGRQDTGEPGIPGLSIELWSPGANLTEETAAVMILASARPSRPTSMAATSSAI